MLARLSDEPRAQSPDVTLVERVLSVGTDVALRAAGIFPATGQPMPNSLFLLATAYRAIYSIFGSYIAARLAPDRPMKHALILGFVGVASSAIGLIATWNRGSEFGPEWYPIALVVLALPCAWIGGKVGEKSSGRPRNEQPAA